MEKKKIYVAAHHNGKTTIWGATLEEMNHDIFSYTLQCGNSWNSKIPTNPKEVKTLVKALNDSANECCRYYDWYEEATPEQIAYFEANVIGNSNNVNFCE